MKKKFLFIPLVSIATFSCLSTTVYAEETDTDPIEETGSTGESVDTNAITFLDKANDFCNKWLTPILSVVSGAVGVGLSILLFYKKLKKKIENHEALTEDDFNEAKSILLEAKDLYTKNAEKLHLQADDFQLQMETMKSDFKAIVESYKATVETQTTKIDMLTAQLSVMKQLLCELVASEPALAINEHASKIIELCDESELEGVE